jgi:hypothetical protein
VESVSLVSLRAEEKDKVETPRWEQKPAAKLIFALLKPRSLFCFDPLLVAA